MRRIGGRCLRVKRNPHRGWRGDRRHEVISEMAGVAAAGRPLLPATVPACISPALQVWIRRDGERAHRAQPNSVGEHRQKQKLY